MEIIVVLGIMGGLAWLDIIPVRYWVKKKQISYEGKKARLKIQIAKWFEDFM